MLVEEMQPACSIEFIYLNDDRSKNRTENYDKMAFEMGHTSNDLL